MSTSSVNYGFIKPDPSEASGPEEIAENMILTERTLTNLHLGTNTGRGDKSLLATYRNTNGSAQAINTEGAYNTTLTWTSTGAATEWSELYDATPPVWPSVSLGLFWIYGSGEFEFYHPGYYMITWNLRLQMSSVAMSEGLVRAALIGTDGNTSVKDMKSGIIGSPIASAMNTMTDITDIGASQLVKVTQVERNQDTGGNTYVTGRNQYEYWNNTSFYRYFNIGFAQNNASSATATPLATETYVHLEFIRSL